MYREYVDGEQGVPSFIKFPGRRLVAPITGICNIEIELGL